MSKRMIVVASGLAVLAIALAALPGPSASGQEQKDAQARSECTLQKTLQEALQGSLERTMQKALQEALQSSLGEQGNSREELARLTEDLALLQADASAQEVVALPQDVQVFTSLEDAASWLGVETAEVNAEKTKELKLPAERGVLLTEIVPDSPAAKAGLKANDVVTEFNGQRVEGAAQFRRMVRETPAGRTVQLTVWRDGRSQTISVTLGEGEQRRHARAGGVPRGDWTIEMPRIPKVEIPRFEWNDGVFFSRRPMLGISADDLSGQLGSYFGAPDGEGVLVREVNSGSPAEKAGIKAGDVIIKVEGARVRTVGDLHEKLREKTGDGADKAEKATVSVGLLRDRKEMTVNVEIERPQAPKARRLSSRRTTI